MTVHDQIEQDLKAAMKDRDRARMSALRMAIAALKNRAVDEGLGPQGRLDDEVVRKVLATEVKRRREAAAAFEQAGRAEQAAAEGAEAAIYEAYLPAQLSDDDLKSIVATAVAAAGASSPQDMGGVMKLVMAEVAGQADGSRVSAMVREMLAQP